MRIKSVVITIGLFFSMACTSQAQHEDPNLQAAYQAHGSLQLKEATDLFQKVADNESATVKDRCEALREIGVISWKFHQSPENAKAYLMKADSLGDYRSETWLKFLRIEEEQGHYSEAVEAGKKALAVAESDADRNYARYRTAKVILKDAVHQLEQGQSILTSKLNEALVLVETVLQENPTNTNASDVLLGIALVQNDATKALGAWLGYYRFADTESAYDYLKPAAQQLEALLSKWATKELDTSEKTQLIKALGASRFYDYAKLLAQKWDIKSEAVTSLIDYADYKEKIRQITNEFYRKSALGDSDSGAYIEAIGNLNRDLYAILSKTDETFSGANFQDLIREQFGTVFIISSSSASRNTGLVFGHIVNERLRTIEQYGHKADFTFTELDMMVSNGFPSWFWEDRGAGGYALSGGFLRIKTMFKFLAINAWEKVTDSVRRQKIEDDIQANLFQSDQNTDIKTVRAALSQKLELDALDELLQNLKAKGYTDKTLQLKFIEAYEALRDNATMFAHEGRHSIDRVVLGSEYRALGSAIIEYRGRLSQIAFSDSPKLEIANMLFGIGQTPTGQSNKMILDVYENWLNENKSRIPGYDANKWPLANLYKLKDQQLREIIRAVDPFYTE
ncbi:hypothetical protein Q2T40_10550 [Winogradskyella maritima]|nr:hypothetical protein [Winogradskyella maritima]